MNSFTFKTRAETQSWAHSILGEFQRPCAVLLAGDLGAGKTQLVRWLLDALGVQNATSPTFAIHQRYASAQGPIDHVDLYRLTSAADLESSGFWDLLLEPNGLLFVEWAERLSLDVWPRHWKLVRLQLFKEGLTDETRRVEIEVRLPF